jgi:hypothetical protein
MVLLLHADRTVNIPGHPANINRSPTQSWIEARLAAGDSVIVGMQMQWRPIGLRARSLIGATTSRRQLKRHNSPQTQRGCSKILREVEVAGLV